MGWLGAGVPSVAAQERAEPQPPPADTPPPAPPDQSPGPVLQDPRSDPVFNSEGVDELTLEMLKRRPAPPPVAPVVPRVRIVIPPDIGQATNPFLGLSPGGLGTGRAELLPEGAFLVQRRGSVVRSGAGDWVFLPHPDAEGTAERAMVLLPSPGLEHIEGEVARIGDRAVCFLSGQVLAYRSQNYILPTAFNVIPADQLAPPVPQPAPAPEPAAEGAGPAQPGAGPTSAESIIGELERRAARPRTISRPVAPGQAESDAKEVAVWGSLASGLLSERRARVVRLGDGRLALAFDRGFGPGPESTMPLLESSALQRLEGFALLRGDATTFTVTGRTVPYRGQAYFLLSGFQMAGPSDVSSLQ